MSCRRVVVAGRRAQVHDRVDVDERRPDGVEIAEVGQVTLDAGHGTAVQRAQRVRAGQLPVQRATDEAGEPGHQ